MQGYCQVSSQLCLSSLLNRSAAVIGGAETEDREVGEVCDSQQEEMDQTLDTKL